VFIAEEKLPSEVACPLDDLKIDRLPDQRDRQRVVLAIHLERRGINARTVEDNREGRIPLDPECELLREPIDCTLVQQGRRGLGVDVFDDHARPRSVIGWPSVVEREFA